MNSNIMKMLEHLREDMKYQKDYINHLVHNGGDQSRISKETEKYEELNITRKKIERALFTQDYSSLYPSVQKEYEISPEEKIRQMREDKLKDLLDE